MKTQKKTRHTHRENRWVLFNNGCIHGVQHSELVLVRSVPHRSLVHDSVAVFTISKTAGFIAALAALVVLMLLLGGCGIPGAQKGGAATSMIGRAGHTNSATLRQSENPKEPSRQTVQSEQTIEYVLPPGTAFGDRRWELGAGGGGFRDRRPKLGGRSPRTTNSYLPSAPAAAILAAPMPVKCVMKDRTETRIGGAQKDTAREWASKAANMQPVMWAGIVMMTLVAGVLAYFGWWTKAAVAVAVGIGMVVLAQTLPDHGALILLGGLSVFALVSLLVLYSYHKGQLDKNHNGVPDFLEKGGKTEPAKPAPHELE